MLKALTFFITTAKKYSFVFLLISLTSLNRMCRIQKNFCFKMRLFTHTPVSNCQIAYTQPIYSLIRSDEGLTLETSAFGIPVRWSIYIINSLDKTKLLYTTPPPMQHHSFLRNYSLCATRRTTIVTSKGKVHCIYLALMSASQ